MYYFYVKKNSKKMFQKLKKLYCKNYFVLNIYTLKESYKSNFFIISVFKKALYNYILNGIFF